MRAGPCANSAFSACSDAHNSRAATVAALATVAAAVPRGDQVLAIQAEGPVLPRDAPHHCTEVETVCLGSKKEGIGAADSANEGAAEAES